MSRNGVGKRTAWLVAGVAAFALMALSTAAQAGPGASPVTVRTMGPSGGTLRTRFPSGRLQDVRLDPFNFSHLLALSDVGLWETTNGATSWHHMTGLDELGQWSFESGSLAFDPVRRKVVLIASPVDHRDPSGTGIYRSTDGGRTWAPAGTAYRPQCESFGTGVTFGSTTTVTFSGNKAFAAGGCVLGVSTDDGATWTWRGVIDNDIHSNGYSSVAVDSAGNAFTCGSGGVYERSTAHSFWFPVVSFNPTETDPHPWTDGEPTGDRSVDSSTCRIATAPNQPEHVFFSATWANDTRDVPPGESRNFSDVFEAYNSGDAGWKWQDLNGPGHNNGRDVVVATRPSTKGGLDLYWDSNDNDFRLECQLTSGFDCPVGATNEETLPDPPWEAFAEGVTDGFVHADTSHFLFQSTAPYCLLGVSGDGGFMHSPNCDGLGTGWGFQNSGISALEPYGLALTSIPELGTDAYLSAQDSGLYSLLADRPGWVQADPGHDGFGIESTIFSHRGDLGRVHLYYNGNGGQYLGDRGPSVFALETATPFLAPWKGINSIGGPQLAQVPTGQVALVVTKPRAPAPPGGMPPSDFPLDGIFLSSDGTTWSQLMIVSGPEAPTLGPTIYGAGTTADPVMFVNASGFLDRIDGVVAPALTSLLLEDTVGPFAAGDANHLLAFACPTLGSCSTDGALLASDDGGTTWRTLDVVTRLAQDDGFGNHYPLDPGGPVDGQINAVAVDPSNTRILTVGTRDTGVFESGDSGSSWERIPLVVPNINNMRFDVFGHLYFTSYGRGLFSTTPTPDTLSLVPLGAAPPMQRWALTARSFTGHPLAGLRVTFSLLASDGTSTPVGAATTDHGGVARIAFTPSVSPGVYKLVAHWNGSLNQELETEATTKVDEIKQG